MNANLKLYAARTGTNDVPRSARAALGDEMPPARTLVVASHKGHAHHAAEQAGVKVNLNGWRVASPPRPHSAAADVDLLLRTRLLFAASPGTVLLSRSIATGFVARFNHAVQRWTRVAEFVDGQAVLLPGAFDEMRWDDVSRRWQIDAGAWRARIYHGGESYSEWLDLDVVLMRNHFPRRTP